MQLLIDFLDGRTLIFQNERSLSCSDVKALISEREGIPICEQRLILQNREICNQQILDSNEGTLLLRFSLRLGGGKGGFGALLRGSGSHTKSGAKNIGFDDCRDLNGRRIRTIKNEKKLSEWREKQAQREIEAKQKKEEERLKKEKENAHHFDHLKFAQTRKELQERITDYVEQGIKLSKKDKKEKNIEDNEESKEKEEEEGEEEGGEEKFASWELDDDYVPPRKSEKINEKRRKVSVSSKEEVISTTTDSTPMSSLNIPVISTTTSKQVNHSTYSEDKQNGSFSNGSFHSSPETPQDVDPEDLLSTKRTIDLDKYSSVEELQVLGLDTLKAELQNLGLMCGGKLEERANRLWQTKGKRLKSELDPSLFPNAKKNHKRKKNPISTSGRSEKKQKTN